MRGTLRSRLSRRRVVGPALRPVGRSVWRSPVRSASRWADRRVLPDTGPSLRSLLALFNHYYRLALKYEKRRNPPTRFKTLGTAEERQRKAEEDLKRAYGDCAFAPAARPEAGKTSRSPADKGAPVPPAPPPQKADVMAVPLAKVANGCWRLDWSRARPAT
jgi:hypothetical protein